MGSYGGSRPAQSLEPPWGRASRLQRCSGSAAKERDLCKTVIATSKVNSAGAVRISTDAVVGVRRWVQGTLIAEIFGGFPLRLDSTETKVESGTSLSKSGRSVNLSDSREVGALGWVAAKRLYNSILLHKMCMALFNSILLFLRCGASRCTLNEVPLGPP